MGVSKVVPLVLGVMMLGAAGPTGQKATAQPSPEMQAVLDRLSALGPKPIPTLSPDEARRQPGPMDAVKARLKSQGKDATPEPVAAVADRMIAGPGGQIPVRIYTPKGAGPFPVILYFHGGGWVIADLDTYDASARALTNAGGAIVVSSHYRQAPEHKFPAAVNDALAAYRWTLDHARALNGDPRLIAVAGESAGGNLATGVAMQARDAKLQMPIHQLLVYPVTDHAFDTDSYREFASAKPLDAAMMQWFWGHYLADPSDGDRPLASVLRGNLAGLPAATMVIAEIDPLRSEAAAYAEALRKAGVEVKVHEFTGVTHEFFGMGAVVPTATDAVQKAGSDLKQAFKAGAVGTSGKRQR